MTIRQAKIQAHRIASQRLVPPPTRKELSGFRTPLSADAQRAIGAALEGLQAAHYDRAHLSPKR